jgi:hypothetical protein
MNDASGTQLSEVWMTAFAQVMRQRLLQARTHKTEEPHGT